MGIDISCVLAALLFTAGNVVRIVFFTQERKRSHDLDLFWDLDPEYLENEWDFRLSKKALFLSSGFLNALAWIVFAFPVIHMAWLLSYGGTRRIMLNMTIAIFALGGAMTEWLSNLFWIGFNVAGKNLVKKVNLDDWVRDDLDGVDGADGMGWRSVEVNHVIGSGFIWLVDTFEWICLAGIFVCTFLSVMYWRREDSTSFGGRWNGLSLFIGLLCILEFVAEILRFEGFRYFGPIGIVYALLNRVLLMPAWILSLGFMLPRAALKQAYTDTNPIASELALEELSSALDSSKESQAQFSIEDIDDLALCSTSPPPEAFANPSSPVGGAAAPPAPSSS